MEDTFATPHFCLNVRGGAGLVRQALLHCPSIEVSLAFAQGNLLASAMSEDFSDTSVELPSDQRTWLMNIYSTNKDCKYSIFDLQLLENVLLSGDVEDAKSILVTHSTAICDSIAAIPPYSAL